MKKKHLRCLLVLLVAVCMVCSIAVPVCAEVLPSAQIGTPETALESDTEKDNTPTPTPTDTPTPEPAPSEAPSTPETSEPAATSETAAPAAPSLDEITTMLYSDLPDAPTGYYVGEYGLPVGTGQTKISLSAWQDELLDESSQGRLDADALNTDTSAMAVAKQPGQDYAIVPIVMQVEYPANGSATTVTLPDDVDLLSYASTEDHLVTASEEERAQILNASYKDSSASASGFYVKATEDFSVTFTYSAPDGTTISKKLDVSINGSAEAAVLPASNSNGVSTYANTPQPPFTTGKITKIEYVVSTWLVWFNGLEAYCCDNGLYAAPGGCPTYNFAYVSKLEPGQYTPGNHYANQVNIWGGLNQLSLGVLTEKHDSTTFSGSEFAANLPSLYSAAGTDTLGKAYQYYDDTQLWIIEHYPNSVAAQTYMKAAAALENNGLDVRPYLGNGGYYTFAYFPPVGYNWQRIVVIGPEIDEDDDTSELPETPEMQYYSADWTAPPQSASGSFDLTYTVHIDKSANITHEKLDDAIFKLTPNPSSGTISGGTWTIGDPQIVTTVDGAASATWTLHYEVTKTSTTTLSGKEGPYNTQEEANAAAEAAKNNAIAQLQNEAQAMVDAAIAEAKAQLATITIDYKETTVPHGFDPTDSSSGSVSVPSNGSATAVVENQPWQAHVTWEKRDALTGGRITEDAEYVFYEWNVDANEYEISSNYRVTRLENGLYTVTVTNPVYTDWTEGYVYYTQDNLGKFRIEEVAAPAGYTDAALQGTDWVEHWSQEFEITASDQTYSYTGNDADYNRPQGNKVIIKKIEAHTGEIIVDDAVFTLYQWNEERGLYEKSKDYAFVRDAEGLYTITCLHDDWSQYEEGNLYYEDTLCDVREDTVNSDGTTTEHPQYYTDYEPIDFSIDERAVTNDGQFVVVESKSPYGYYGDWTGDEDRTNYEAEDAGKRAYYIRLTDDGSTITIGNGNYNANVLTENQGGTLIDLGDKVVSLEVFGEAATEYPEDALYKNNPWYSSLTWEKRDALTGGRITEDAEYEIQEWNPEKGQYEKSTHYRVVRRDDGLYTVNLIDGAFFPGWEGKQGYVYYHQANEGKYRLVELTSPAGYTDAALQDGNWGEQWSQEFEVNDGHLTFSYTGKDADYNQPKGNRLVIKKIEAHTGEIIEDDAVFTLYQWNQARGLYEVSKDYGDSSEYFNETARGLITGLVLLVSQYGQDGERHIVSVFNLIVELAGADNPEKGNTVQKSRLAAMLEGVTDRRIKGYISTTTSADIRTTLNIVSSALSKLLKFVDAELEQLICTHDNDLDAERFIERPTAIFLIAPDENETRHFLASLFVRFLTDDLIALAERQGGHCPRPFYYFLDEFGNFPAIPGVTSLFSAIRSRGGRILVAVQSYSQFLLKYDKNVTEIIKDNCQILLNTFVSPSAQDTATSISKMLGDETILTGSTSKSDGKTTSSHQLMGRPLLSPAQMVRIQRDTWIVEKAGYAPMKTHLEGYWKYLSLAPQEQDAAGENDYLEIKLLSTESLRQALGSASTRPHTPPAATREPRRKLGASRREAAALYPGKFNP